MSNGKYSQLQYEMEFLAPLRLEQRRIAADVSLADIAYLAGVVDGEGSILVGFAKPRPANPLGSYQLRLQVVNTNHALITWCQEKFGAHVSEQRSRVRQAHHDRWKTGYAALWYSGFAKETIRLIEPYLIIKRPHAHLALEYPTDKRHKDRELRERIYAALRALNKKGPS